MMPNIPRRTRTRVSMATGAVSLAFLAASSVAADELILVGGAKVPGVVVREARDGVWIETEPYTAVHFPYDKVIRANKWNAKRNAALIDRSKVPAPTRAEDGKEILRTREGTWIEVQPRIARLIPHTVSSPDSGTTVKRAAPEHAVQPSRLAALQELARTPEPLTPSQFSRRVGPPQKRERTSDGTVRWHYDLGDDGRAVATFRADGTLEDVFIDSSDDA